MAKKKPLRIGLIGYGFMGRTHSNAFRKVPNFFPELKYEPQLAAVCARNKERAEDFAEQWGYESVETDWKKLVARDDIDVIDIAAPNNVHHEIAIAAANGVIKSFASRKSTVLNSRKSNITFLLGGLYFPSSVSFTISSYSALSIGRNLTMSPGLEKTIDPSKYEVD